MATAKSDREYEDGTAGYEDTYTESQVILNAVKIIAPFTLTYGMFMTLHGADTPGGSFQGGAIIGVTVLMLAFAFGIEPTRRWLKNTVIVSLVAGGVAIFVGVGLATMALGGAFLQYEMFGISPKWGMEAIEVGGIALIVAGVVITLFFATAAGFTPERRRAFSSSSSSSSSTSTSEVTDND